MTDSRKARAAELLHLRQARLKKGDPVALPLTMSSMYHLPGDPKGAAQYGRFDNATWQAVEELLGHLEQAPALAFPSGMAAISAVFFTLLRSGDRILLPSDGYYTTRVLSGRFLSRFDVGFDLRPTASYLDGGFEGHCLVFVETPANPGLDVCDLAAVAKAAHASGALVVADNTTMTPFGQRPLDLGADIVVAADTKAPNGHSDALFGHVATRHPRSVRGLASPSRSRDARVALRAHVRQCRIHRAAAGCAPERNGGPLSRPARRSLARSGAHADGALRLPDRTHPDEREGRGCLHRRVSAHPARDVVRRRAHLCRASRALGRRRRSRLRETVDRMRTGRGIVERDRGSAGSRGPLALVCHFAWRDSSASVEHPDDLDRVSLKPVY